ncbi:MAG: hypothetical protein NZ693_03955, partial [Thermoflexales bacterium]|nr:hypothetical protein [Thermoflexales bacterium]
MLSLLFVLSVGLGLRLFQLDLVDLRYDEASTLFFARGIAEGHWLAIAPFSGSVLNHPAAYLYAMAFPYLFTRDALLAVAWRALLDVAAIGLTWWMCYRHFGVGVAFVAALLFAVSPWAVQMGRRTGITVLPLGATLALWGVLELARCRSAWGGSGYTNTWRGVSLCPHSRPLSLREKGAGARAEHSTVHCASKSGHSPWGWVLVGWGLALTLGAHWTGLYLLPLTIGVMLWRWRRARLVPVLVGFLPLTGVLGAYVAFDAGQSFANLRALLDLQPAEARWSLDALWAALWLSGGAHLSDLTGPAFPVWREQLPPLLPLLDEAQMGWMLLSAGIVGSTALRGIAERFKVPSPPNPPLLEGEGAGGEGVRLLVLAWFAAPILLQLRHAQPIQMHYLLPTYPAGFVLMALGAQAAINLWRPSRYLLLVGLLTLVGWQMFTTLRFAEFVQAHVTDPGGYGPPLRSALRVAEQARRAIQTGEANEVILVLPRDDPAVHEPATVLDVVMADLPRRFANATNGMILREGGALYVFAPETERARAALAQHGRIVDELTIPVRQGSDRAYRYVRTAGLHMPSVQPHPAQWAGGFGLLGYHLTETTSGLRLESYVRAFAQPREPAIHWFSHLYAGGTRVAQQDTGGIRPSQW